MLDSPAVHATDNGGPGPLRVGFVTQLLWDRYGEFWRDLVVGAGAVAEFPRAERVKEALAADETQGAPSVSFRLAVAQAAALTHCDLVVLPRLNPETDSQRGSAQDRWVADLPGAVADSVGSLEQVYGVAAYPDPEIETSAVLLLQRLLGDRAAVPRVWSRHRRAAERQAVARPARGSGAAAARPLAAGGAVAVISQPWLLSEKLEARLRGEDERLVTQLSLDPARCRAEAWRVDDRLIGSDAEVLGAARILSRRAGVESLRFLLDEGSDSDAWLLRRLRQASHKPVEPWPWQQALGARGEAGAGDVVDVLLNLPVD